MMRKPPALRSIGIDRDAQVLEAFICDHPVELVHGCAHAFLSSFPFPGRELVYSDPPYLKAIGRPARRYRFDSTEANPVALPDRLKRLPCQVIVSGHPSALYDATLADWRCKWSPMAWCGPRSCGVHLRARPRAPDALRGPDLHRLPAHHAQGGQPGPALRGTAAR